MTEIKHKKNTAKELMIAMVDSATPANLKAGLTVTDTAYYKDGAGAWTSLAITDAVTEIGSSGMYTLEFTAAELNHDFVMVKLTSAGAADTVHVIDMTTQDIDDISAVIPDAAGVAPTATENADAIWDEVLTGGTHNVSDSAGKRLREMFDAGLYEEETAQAGSNNTITLAAGASALDDFYNMSTLTIIEGTGAGQMRTFKDYNGTTKVATACMNWSVNPDNTSKYVITGHACSGVFQMQTGVYDLINAECDLALSDYGANTVVPPTAAELNSAHGAGSWLTGAGGSSPTVEEIRIEMDTNSVDLNAILADTNELQTNQGNWATATGFNTVVPDVAGVAATPTEVATALTNYDGPTRTEATADKDAIITQVNANETKIDAISTVVPDVAGTAAALHTTTDALINGLDDITVAEIKAGIADGTYDLEEMIRLIFSACCAKVSGGGSSTLIFRDGPDSKNRVTATVDASGNRTAVTLDGN